MKHSNKIQGIIVFFSLIIIVDIGSGFLLRKNFSNINYGIHGLINRGLNSKKEILILGSSRAMHHYDPEVFEDYLGLSCYNTGIGGYGIFYNYALLNEIVKKNIPKIIILDLSPNILVDKNSYKKLNVLLPYFKEYESFSEIIKLDPKFSNLELISNLYIYNSTIYEFFRDYFTKELIVTDGYLPLKGTINKTKFTPFYNSDLMIDSKKLIYIKKIIELCHKNDIELIGVVSPTYLKFDRENKLISKVKPLFSDYNFDFFNYSDLPLLYGKREFFRDQIHLNDEGAQLFSEMFSEVISSD